MRSRIVSPEFFQHRSLPPALALSALGAVLCFCKLTFVRKQKQAWSERRDLNTRPSAPKADALPGCATLRRLPVSRSSPSTRYKRNIELRNHDTRLVHTRCAEP